MIKQEQMKCKLCEDKGYIPDPAAWNATLQEHIPCPNGCKRKGNPPPNFLAT